MVLAAGEGSRFIGSTHKLLAPFRGRPLVLWAVEAARAARLDAVIVVTGAVDLDDVLPAEVVASQVRNHDWARGQATSLRAGWITAEYLGHDAVVVGLGDQPLVPPDAWARVAAATETPIATAVFDGRRCPPVRLAAEVWPLLPVDGDEGARSLLRERQDLVTEVPCPGRAIDIDTVEDLARWS